MFSLAELTRELQAGQLDPEWLVVENTAGVSYNEFVKKGNGQWVKLSDLSTICSPTDLAAAAAKSDSIDAQSLQVKPAVEERESVSAAELRAFMRTIEEAQAKQVRLLAAIRWAIVGLGIWFIIQFWFLPKLILSMR